jgi:hypothetical protein
MLAQAKLGVGDEEFAKWRFAYIDNLRKPDYLEDEEVVAARFARQSGALASTQEARCLFRRTPRLRRCHACSMHSARDERCVWQAQTALVRDER